MPKVFIMTEQELNEYNSAKQLQVLDFIAKESLNNPHYDLITLLTLAQNKVAESTGVWNYNKADANEANIIVESQEAELTLDSNLVEAIDSDFDSAQEELIAEAYIEPEEILEVETPIDLEESDFEEDIIDEEEEDSTVAAYRRPMWKGLWSEANKLDKV